MLQTKNILAILLLCCYGLLSAQCPNFTDLTDTSVTCQYGYFSNPFQYTGIAVGRHTVITQQGADPRTGYQLPFLPPGEDAVVKLGNEQIGAEAEAITYNFTVNPDSSILLIKFAVVLEDPDHYSYAQPRFVMRVLNNNGQLVDECAEYDVTASGNIPGFNSFYYSYGSIIRWRPWTKFGIDLSDYIGQQIRLQFVTYDCLATGHFGYAYFTASCISNTLTLNGCDGSDVTLLAPSGFESYHWNNGVDSTTSTYTVSGTTMANCLITSFTGCQFIMSGTFSSDSEIPVTSLSFYDTICEGDTYNEHMYNLPPLYRTGTHSFLNTFFDNNDCSGGDLTTTLHLTVLPRYTHIYATICEGTDYDEYGFHYTNLQTGEYSDSIIVERPDDCDSITILHLTVVPTPNLPNIILGDNQVCCNEVYTYSLSNAEELTNYHWSVPNGVVILFGQGTSSVSLYFTDAAPNPTTISFTGSCGSGNILTNVYHYPTYHIFLQDTICTGEEYHRYGFDLSRQDSAGWHKFMNYNTTTNGCDSIRILQLLATNTPSLTALSQPSEICEGQNTIVHALGENAGFVQNVTPPVVAIGDILCTDYSIEKLSEWPIDGKTAMGIVFYVDSTNTHGWAIDLQESDSVYQWRKTFYDLPSMCYDIPNVINFAYARYAISDIDGINNTLNIRNAGNNIAYPAAYAVGFNSGWYLPALGQLNLIFSELNTLNVSLQAIGSDVIIFGGYWSSTEYDNCNAWYIDSEGKCCGVAKTQKYKVRSVRNF